MKRLYLILAIGLVSTFLMARGDMGMERSTTNETVVEINAGTDLPVS